MFERADGMYYYSKDGNKIFDATGGLWCSNAGHNHPIITKAIQEQTAKMDYAPSFQLGHELPFQYAQRLVDEITPEGLDKVFFTMCGSTAVDSALKIALAYHKAEGNPDRTVFIGRHRGYHGVGFGGISVGGMPPNRIPYYGSLLPNVDHLPATHDLEHQAFSKGVRLH